MLAASPILRHAGNVYIVELGLPPGCLAERPTPRRNRGDRGLSFPTSNVKQRHASAGSLPRRRRPSRIPLRGNERPERPGMTSFIVLAMPCIRVAVTNGKNFHHGV